MTRQSCRTTILDTQGPYDLSEVALMGFGHQQERSFDGIMRMAFCVDDQLEEQVGVEARQSGDQVELTVRGADTVDLRVIADQVARVISLDHDGQAFVDLCAEDLVLSALQERAPGFRPALFYSPYEAALWSVLSHRRAGSQAIGLRSRMAEQHGSSFECAGTATWAVPTPSAVLGIDELPGLPADRVPRLHAVAEAARSGQLSVSRLTAMSSEEAIADLQQLPGFGPF